MVKIELHELRRELQLSENENNKNTKSNIRRGDIYWVNLGEPKGNIQGGVRPCIVTSNDIGNKFSPIVSVAPLSTQIEKCKLPTHAFIGKDECLGLSKDSFLMAEQIRPIDKTTLGDYIGYIMNDRIDKAISISLGLTNTIKDIKDEIHRKVREIKELDIFIQKWLNREGDVNKIQIDIEDRKLRVKELIVYCSKNGQDVELYYDINCIKGDKEKKRLVG